MIDPLERLSNLENAYDISSPFCKFTFEFQNLIQVPNTLESTQTYPVVLRGYPELKKRSEQQKATSIKIEGSLDALIYRIEKNSSKGKMIEQRMENILIKLRNSELRTILVAKKKFHFPGGSGLGTIPDIQTYQAPNSLVKALVKMRLVLQKLLEATKAEKNTK